MDVHQQLTLLFQGSLSDKVSALYVCNQQLEIDPQSFATTLPIVLGQVAQQDPVFRIELLQFLQTVLSRIDSFTHEQIRFAVMAGCIETFCYLLTDETIAVQKKLISVVTNTIEMIFKTFCTCTPNDQHKSYWELLTALKTRIDSYFDHPNQGVKIRAVRFLEKLVQMQSGRGKDSKDVSLDIVPLNHPFIQPEQLQIECTAVLNRFLAFLANTHLFYCTATFVSAVLNSMHEIIKKRPQFSYPCIEAFLKWERNKPAHFTQLDTKNVQRNLKIILISCFGLPSTEDFKDQIQQLATHYGARPHEFQARLYRESKRNESNRRDAKRQKVDDSMVTELEPDIMEALIANLHSIPLELLVDATIQTVLSYDQSVWEQELKKYLAAQYGTAVETINVAENRAPAANIVPKTVEVSKVLAEPNEIKPELALKLALSSMHRVLEMGDHFLIASTITNPTKIISVTNDTLLAARFGWMLMLVRLVVRSGIKTDHLKNELLLYVLEDFKNRMDICMLWLHEEFYQDHCLQRQEYRKWVFVILDALRDGYTVGTTKIEPLDTTERIFTRFLVELPQLESEVFNRVLEYCKDEDRMLLGISSLRDLMIFRPAIREDCRDMLLEYSIDSNYDLRSAAIEAIVSFISNSFIAPFIEEFALRTIRKLLNFQLEVKTEEEGVVPEFEDLLAIYGPIVDLFFGCLEKKQSLFQELFEMFPKFVAHAQDAVVKLLQPRLIPMSSEPQEMLRLIHEFPSGSEKLALCMIQTLIPSTLGPQVIQITKNAYIERDLDVRFLILVIPTFEKKQILEHLPRLIDSLDETEEQSKIILEVFLKLVDTSQEDDRTLIPPPEFLVRIHNLEDTVDLKKIIQAINLCLSEQEVFKQEVLAIVLSQLVEQRKLPQLLLRTIIQSIKIFPGIIAFAMKIMSRLVERKIWKSARLWDGFIRCCTINFPASIPVILSLHPNQGVELFKKSPQMGPAVEDYIDSLPPHQRGRQDVRELLRLLDMSKSL